MCFRRRRKQIVMDSSLNMLLSLLSLPMFNYSTLLAYLPYLESLVHITLTNVSTIVLFSIVNKWYEEIRDRFEAYDSMYESDSHPDDCKPDQVIMGLLEELKSHPVTMKEAPIAWYSVALTQFHVPWISAKAPPPNGLNFK